jgi:hypothetical protein
MTGDDARPAVTEIRIEHLSKEEVLDIEARAKKQGVRREEEPVPVGSQGEPVTFAIVLLGGIALRAYVAHLKYKESLEPDEVLTSTVTTRFADGSEQTKEVRYERREGEEFDAAAIRELTAIPGLEALAEEPA